MALHVYTPQPKALLAAIIKEIKDKKVVNWLCDGDGDFTHNPPDAQWTNKAYFEPHLYRGELRLNIRGYSGGTVSRAVYAIYHTRFMYVLLYHFSGQFILVSTSNPITGDSPLE